MEEPLLYNSAICRLCAENNMNGELLYSTENEKSDLSSMINRYLPIKIHDDGKLPRMICPGCNIQLEATIQFFELLVEGQRKIREMWKYESEQQKKLREKLRIEHERIESFENKPHVDNYNNKNDNNHMSEEILIKLSPDGSMYSTDHDVSLQIEGLDKPKRKRGRPPKIQVEEIVEPTMNNETFDNENIDKDDKQDNEEDDDEYDEEGRRRRKRKAPKRYSEAVQGQELERIFQEEGVYDDEDDQHITVEALDNVSLADDDNEEIIGHLENEEGKDLGKFITVNRSRGRGRPKLARKKPKYTCNICRKGFSQRHRYIMHKNLHKNIKYECTTCKTQFNNLDNLSLHCKNTGHVGEKIINPIIQDESMKYTENSSIYISEEFIDQKDESLVSELTNEKQESIDLNSSNDYEMMEELDKTFDFDDVKKSSPTKELSDDQITKNNSENDKSIICIFCNKSFEFESSLKSHLLTHETMKTDKYPCDICGKILNHPSSVVYHKEAEHNNGRRFVCNKCNKSFKHKQLLQRHQLVHSDDRPYHCKSCDAKFKTKANLINHGSTHTGEKKYTCEICKQSFAHKTSLTLHHRWHNGEKPFTCTVCNKSFSQNGNLQEHMRIHTGVKPYECTECKKKFTTSSQYKLHLKRHTGERPWECEKCEKTFLHKDTWKCHMRRHNNDNPYKCDNCDRKFPEQWALKKHLRLHTGEKPYSCNICGKKFADCSNLTKHKKVHNKIIDNNDTIKINDNEEIWQILPAQQLNNNNQINNIIEAEDESEDGTTKYVCITYPDLDYPNQSKIMNVNVTNDNNYREEFELSDNNQSLTNIDIQNTELIEKNEINEDDNDNNFDDKIEIDETDPNLQIQITDEYGRPISTMTIQEARQLLSTTQFVNNKQIIKIQTDEENCEFSENFDIHGTEHITFDQVDDNNEKIIQQNYSIGQDSNVKVVDEDNFETVTDIQQLEDNDETVNTTEDEQTYAFIAESSEGIQNMRSSYSDDSHILGPEYIPIG